MDDVIALNPAHMTVAQDRLLDWIAGKIKEADDHASEVAQVSAAHHAAGFDNKKMRRLGTIARARGTFYRKVQAALQAGYYIIPPFPVELFAIRTDRGAPARGETYDRWSRHQQNAQALPLGEGEYRSDIPAVYQRTGPTGKMLDGNKPEVKTSYWAQDWKGVEFPVLMVRPEIIEATHRAMKLKIFDQFGILPNQRRNIDPIIVGQIKRPFVAYGQPLTFFVAWWLDPKTI